MTHKQTLPIADLLPIRSAAKQLGVNEAFLRYQELLGNIKPLYSASGQRKYTQEILADFLMRVGTSEPLYTAREAADYLGVSTSTLRRWHNIGKLVAYRSLGKFRRYTQNDLDTVKAS